MVLQVVRLCERDADHQADCFVFVCEQLRRNDLRRLRKFDPSGAATFTTWLRAVVRNLHLDWRRHRFGRPRAFRSITRLSALDQAIFRHVHEQGATVEEALLRLRSEHPSLAEAEVARSLERIAAELTPRQRWLLALRGMREERLSGFTTDGREVERELEDEQPGPEMLLSNEQEREALARALKVLEPIDRLLIRLHFEEGIGFEQIGRLTGLGNGLKVSRHIGKVLDRIRAELSREQTSRCVSVKFE